MSCGCASKAARASARVAASRASTSPCALDRYGGAMRGQENCGNRATFTGSVLVSDIV